MIKKKNIFLVDDDQAANFINEMQINRFSNSLNIQTFISAKEALEELNDNLSTPDFIFLDINMPEIDGWDFIKKFKKLDLRSKIILVTSSLDPTDKLKAKSMNEVIAFIEKPMVKKDLVPLFTE